MRYLLVPTNRNEGGDENADEGMTERSGDKSKPLVSTLRQVAGYRIDIPELVRSLLRMAADRLATLESRVPPTTQPQAEKPVLWWNGFRRYDEPGGTYPSVSENEDTYHDIPLYAGWNAAAASAPSAIAPNRELIEAALDVVKWLDSKEVNDTFRQAGSLHLSHPHLGVKIEPSFSEWAAKVLRRFRTALDVAEQNAAVRTEITATDSEVLTKLQDPTNVCVNMIRGVIARPSIRSLLHVHGEKALAIWDAANGDEQMLVAVPAEGGGK